MIIEMIEELAQLLYEEKLQHMGLFGLGGEWIKEDMIKVYKSITGLRCVKDKMDKEKLFSPSQKTTTQVHAMKLNTKRIMINKRIFFKKYKM